MTPGAVRGFLTRQHFCVQVFNESRATFKYAENRSASRTQWVFWRSARSKKHWNAAAHSLKPKISLKTSIFEKFLPFSLNFSLFSPWPEVKMRPWTHRPHVRAAPEWHDFWWKIEEATCIWPKKKSFLKFESKEPSSRARSVKQKRALRGKKLHRRKNKLSAAALKLRNFARTSWFWVVWRLRAGS